MTRADDELANQMVTSLDTLALAAVQKNETLEQLIKINEMKEITLKNLMAQLAAEKNNLLQTLGHHQQSRIENWGKQYFWRGSSTASKWNPNGYCWSHGYKVTKNHNSNTCRTRKDGHKEEATRANTMGGSTENINWKPQS